MKATAVPSPEITGAPPELTVPPGPSPRLTTSVVPALTSRTYTAWRSTPGTMFAALAQKKAAFVPSALTVALPHESAAGPFGPVLTRIVSPVVRSRLKTSVWDDLSSASEDELKT